MKVNIKNSELKVKIDTEKTKTNLIDLTVSPTDNTQIFNHPNSDGYDVVTVEGIESEQVQIIPTKSEQIYNGLYNTIYVDPIPEQYIIPEGTININESGTVDVKDYEYAYVNIGGGETPEPDADVTFYDYDGSVVYTYTKEQFLALTEMPENPSHEGLTAQGWNWPFDKAQEYVEKYRYLSVGQMYITDDNSTRIYITIDDEALLSPSLGLYLNGYVTVDWGDGTTTTVNNNSLNNLKNTKHTYSTTGDYVITIKKFILGTPQFSIGGRSDSYTYEYVSYLLNDNGNTSPAFLSLIKKIEFGSYITTFKDYALTGMNNLESVTLPNTITSLSQYSLYSVPNIILPTGITLLQNGSCQGITNYYTKIHPQKIVLNYGLTNITNNSLGARIGKKLTIPPTLTQAGGGYCFANSSFEKIIIPEEMTSIQSNSFQNTKYLDEIIIEKGITTLMGNLFQGSNIKKIIYKGDITSIGQRTFMATFFLEKMYFLNNTSVPTITSGTFYNGEISSYYKIVVPDELYNDWISAQYWSNIASHIIRESDDV